MEAYFPGPMPNNDFFQAVWQFRQDFVDRYATSVQIKEATIDITFCDERGREVTLRNKHGKQIKVYNSPGAYRSAADFYDAQSLEPEIITGEDKTREDKTSENRSIRNVPFSPL